MNILVTGPTGFVGGRIIDRISADGIYNPIAMCRKGEVRFSKNIKITEFDSLFQINHWGEILDGIDIVIHTVARVHIMNDTSVDPLTEFRRVNLDGTLNIAKNAAKFGVKRFVFLSSIKVNGESTKPGKAFTEADIPQTVDSYGISKCETEIALFQLAEETGMEVVCIRPPLVYGPGVKANFLDMMKWLNMGIPLPFGAIHNKRSLVALDNLIDLIITCIDHPNAANQVFLAGDGEDLSTTELLKKVSLALGKSPKLIPVPQKILEFILNILGKRDLSQRLCGSLQVDISKARNLLGWKPPISVQEGLDITAKAFLNTQD